MPRLGFCLLVAAMFVAAPIAAQIRQGPPGFREKDEYSSTPPFSGALLRGLTNAAPPHAADPASVILFVPPNQVPGSRVCIHLYSSDSSYRGRFRYDQRPAESGWYRFT